VIYNKGGVQGFGSISFDMDTDPGSALKKMDPDPKPLLTY